MDYTIPVILVVGIVLWATMMVLSAYGGVTPKTKTSRYRHEDDYWD